jgi:hypothetical protein
MTGITAMSGYREAADNEVESAFFVEGKSIVVALWT